MHHYAIVLVDRVTGQEEILPAVYSPSTIDTALRKLNAPGERPAGCRYVAYELATPVSS